MYQTGLPKHEVPVETFNRHGYLVLWAPGATCLISLVVRETTSFPLWFFGTGCFPIENYSRLLRRATNYLVTEFGYLNVRSDAGDSMLESFPNSINLDGIEEAIAKFENDEDWVELEVVEMKSSTVITGLTMVHITGLLRVNPALFSEYHCSFTAADSISLDRVTRMITKRKRNPDTGEVIEIPEEAAVPIMTVPLVVVSTAVEVSQERWQQPMLPF